MKSSRKLDVVKRIVVDDRFYSFNINYKQNNLSKSVCTKYG